VHKQFKITKCAGFDNDLKRAQKLAPWVDEFMDGAIAILRANPGWGKRIGESSVFCIFTKNDLSPAFGLYYPFDTKEVWLLSLTRTETPLP
jgi:hypothetical protein